MKSAYAAIAGVLILGLTGCASSHRTAQPPPAVLAPVTITHALGQTTVDGTPAHIVALGSRWLDAAQALDVTPIAYLDEMTGPGTGTPPWEPAALSASKALATSGNLVDEVTALHPDLILVDPFLAATHYADLSKIAPTLPGLTADPVTPWPDQLRALGQVLRKPAAADQLIAGIDARIDGIAQRTPTLKSATFVDAWLTVPTRLLVLTDPADPSGSLFTRLGMTIPAHLVDEGGTSGRLTLPADQLSRLDADLLLAAYSPGLDETYGRLPGFADLPATRKHAVTLLTTQELTALTQPTALSLPYLLTKLEPALVNAATPH